MDLAHESRESGGDHDQAVTEAVGRASEALEYVERARGHLYSLHQLIGRADILFEEAAGLFEQADHPGTARQISREVVGRNVLDGRWTFQIVEEFDDLYHGPVTDMVRQLEETFHQGQRHVHEARMKEERRTHGRTGHERRPAAAHDPDVETDQDLPGTPGRRASGGADTGGGPWRT